MEREINKELIEKQAKDILDKFAKALEKVEKEKGEVEGFIDREEFERKEGLGKDCDDGFKKRIIENAPNKDDDFIIGERRGWK